MTKQVTARMTCQQVEDQNTSADPSAVTAKSVRLHPVYSEDKTSPNYSFSQATPSGLLQLNITNPGAYSVFEAGEEYDIIITHRPKADPNQGALDIDTPAPAPSGKGK